MTTPSHSQPQAAGEAAHNVPRLAVMACPDYAGKHPFHDRRWIVTEGTEVERGHDPRPGQWFTRNGSLVAEMRDSCTDYAASIVRAYNSHAALVAVAQAAASQRASDLAQAHQELSDCLEDESASVEQLRAAAVALCLVLNSHKEKARAALALANGGQK
jgi:hypothetical protein